MLAILFATEKEAEPLRRRKLPPGVRIFVSGMGPDAARRTTEEAIRQGAERVLNAGVCAALSPEIPRGSVFRIERVANEDDERAIDLPVEPGNPLPLARLASVERPLFEPARRERLAQRADLVEMEGFAIADVCRRNDVPCILVKGVTDFADESGRNDIRTHLSTVSEAVARALLDLLPSDSIAKRLRSFTKLEHVVFSLPLVFAGAWLGAGGPPGPRTLLLLALVALGARTFGMALNRILDRDVDALNPRTRNRELPSGRLALSQALAVALAGLLAYLLGCALLGPLVLRLSWLPLLPLSLYSLLKRFTPLCHYGIGLCLAAAPLGAHLAVAGSLRFPPDVLWLALFAFCWISGFDVIYALQDVEFDRKHGLRSLPAALGPRRALLPAALTHLVAFVALLPLVDSPRSALSAATAGLALLLAYLPSIPLPLRFFPLSAVAGVAGALVPML